VTHGLVRGAQALGTLKSAAFDETNPLSGGLRTYVKNLEYDNLSPQSQIEQILPEDTARHVARTGAAGMGRRYWGSTRQPWTEEMVEDVVRQHLAGNSAADIEANLAAAAPAGAASPGEASIRTLIKEFRANTRSPVN